MAALATRPACVRWKWAPAVTLPAFASINPKTTRRGRLAYHWWLGEIVFPNQSGKPVFEGRKTLSGSPFILKDSANCPSSIRELGHFHEVKRSYLSYGYGFTPYIASSIHSNRSHLIHIDCSMNVLNVISILDLSPWNIRFVNDRVHICCIRIWPRARKS